MRRRILAWAAVAAIAASPAAALEVVASIKPLHSLVAGVMGDTGTPRLIVRGADSPHTYSLRPSDAAALEAADLVFWIGPGLENFLEKPLATLARDAAVVEIAWQKPVALLPLREDGAFEAHQHDHDHDDAAHAHHHEDDHAHGTGPGQHTHGPEQFDMHLWLDPQNAVAAVAIIESALSKADPDNAASYRTNAEALRGRISDLTTEIEARLAPVKGKPFVVFHDAYQYFESRFGMPATASITVSPEVMPGADRIATIRQRIVETGAVCVFAEPQFEPRLVHTLIEGTSARAGVLDPEGGAIEEGPDLYFSLLGKLAADLASCLGSDNR